MYAYVLSCMYACIMYAYVLSCMYKVLWCILYIYCIGICQNVKEIVINLHSTDENQKSEASGEKDDIMIRKQKP